MLRWLDCSLGLVVDGAKWLALPIVALLFLQWPLRDIVQCCSREANDIGQIAFALFIAVAITAATRARSHLAADSFARSFILDRSVVAAAAPKGDAEIRKDLGELPALPDLPLFLPENTN